MSVVVRVNPIFSDHMVLQRQSEVPVWGTGADGTVVKVRCRGEQAETIAEHGSWKVTLPAAEAGGPYELAVETDEQSIVFHDVWFGDVWLAGGQSNMEWSLAQSADAAAEIAASDIPNLRFFDVPRVAYED
jgi:sialate O-acetylesterase